MPAAKTASKRITTAPDQFDRDLRLIKRVLSRLTIRTSTSVGGRFDFTYPSQIGIVYGREAKAAQVIHTSELEAVLKELSV